MGDRHGRARPRIEKPNAMGVAGTRMLAPAVCRELAMDEIEHLADDRQAAADEGREPEFRGMTGLTIEKIAARSRAEEAGMARKRRREIVIEVRPLLEHHVAVTIFEPVGIDLRRAHDLLEADHVGIRLDQPRHQPVVEQPAPCVEREDAHA